MCREIRRVLGKTLARPVVSQIMREIGPVLERGVRDLERVQLRAFHRDEMAACTDILKLRKLAMCRLGEPGYLDYRRLYFDGKGSRKTEER